MEHVIKMCPLSVVMEFVLAIFSCMRYDTKVDHDHIVVINQASLGLQFPCSQSILNYCRSVLQ